MGQQAYDRGTAPVPIDVRTHFMRRFRLRRAVEMIRCFPQLREMKVIDLGGSESFWALLPRDRIPADLTILNLRRIAPTELGARHLMGDACEAQSRFAEGQFDLVVSNSVIEHVGGHHRRKQFAAAIHWLASRHWVQTPSLYFPVEPHWLFPGFWALPFDVRVSIARRWPFGHLRAESWQEAVEQVAECELITRSQLRLLFPESEIWGERAFGLTKSLVAIRT